MIRDEDLVRSNGQALSVITPPANKIERALESRNANPIYDPIVKQRAATALLALDNSAPCWNIYDKAAMEQLLVRG